MYPKPTSRSLIDASLLIVAATALLYFCSYIFETSEFGCYKLPAYLIDTSLNTTLNFSLKCLPILTIMMLFLIALHDILILVFNIPKIGAIRVIFLLAYFELFIFAGLGSIFINYWSVWNVYIVIFGLDLIVMAIVAYHGFKGNKFTQNTEPSEFTKVVNNTYVYYLYFLTVISFLLFSFMSGNSVAKEREYYYVLAKNPNIVILEKNESYLIAKPYSPKNHKLSDSVILYKISDTQPVIMLLKHIGQLR